MDQQAAGQGWDIETDILVVGSGAGALTAALTAADHHADVLVIEKSELFGGTSATSGGGIWIPASDAARAAGAQDTPEEGFAYIKALAGDAVDDARIWAYVRQGPAMLAYLEKTSSLEFVSIPYTDYHAELPGGKHGYRTHECKPIHADSLGAEFRDIAAAASQHDAVWRGAVDDVRIRADDYAGARLA